MCNSTTADTTRNPHRVTTVVTINNIYYLKRTKLEKIWKGWVRAIQVKENNSIYLPEYTRVEYLGIKTDPTNKKEYVHFIIKDNGCVPQIDKDTKAIIQLNNHEAKMSKDNFFKYFDNLPPDTKGADVVIEYSENSKEDFSPIRDEYIYQEWGKMQINKKSVNITLNSIYRRKNIIGASNQFLGSNYTPMPEGTHKILRPDNSHADISTEPYRNTDIINIYGNDVWFPIEIASKKTSRYIHIGHLSEGCATVYELSQWGMIYDYLISKRENSFDSKYIGTLTVLPYKRDTRGAY